MQKLYYEDPHLSRFTATVLSCEETDRGYALTLDATAFYPEGGGQAADTGILGGVRVLDTKEQGETVVHTCDKPLEVGALVEGVIDYGPRFLRMQQHSGEHIVSGIIHRRYGYHNTGFHMGADTVTIDFDGVIPAEDLASIEAEANAAVWQNLPIRCWYPSPEELPTVPYRTKRQLPWPVRIVEIPGFDICACCGTHVKKTGEIGIIKITSFQNYKGGTRLFMLCGERAFKDYQSKNRDVNRVTVALSVKPEEICPAVKRLEEEITEHKIYESSLKKELFALKAERLGKGERVCVFESGLTPDEIRRFALTLAENFKVAAVFCGGDGNQKYAIASKSENCNAFAKAVNTAFAGRGGGKQELCQGSCGGNRAEIEKIINEL